MSRGHLDAAAGSSFLSLTIDGATTLIKNGVESKLEGGKKNTKRNAYHEGDGYAFRKNRSFDKRP